MNALVSIFGSLQGSAGAPWVLSLVARWTVLLALAWVAQAALAGRNPRWKVALWRAVAIGVAVIPTLACAPLVVRWQLADADRSVTSNLVGASGTFADAADPGNGIPPLPAHGP